MGVKVGMTVGEVVGKLLGTTEEDFDGASVELEVGEAEGIIDGLQVGKREGTIVNW